MEVKKSQKANLEKQKNFSFLLGLVLSLSIIFVALEWGSVGGNAKDVDRALDVADLEDVMVIQDEQPEEPPTPEEVPEQQLEVTLPEEFKVVDDSKEVAKVVLVSADEKRELPPPAPIVTKAPVEEEAEDKIFEVVEEQPIPPGGSIEAMLKIIQKNLRYPEQALDHEIQGRVVVRFVVERDGSVSKPEVMRPIDPALDKEAVRVISTMGKWQPGKHRGKPVRSYYIIPVIFKIG